MEIREGGLDEPQVIALLQQHLAAMHEHSPRESVHALDISGLTAPHVTFWTAWREGQLMGCGALRELDPEHGEIKSMRTATDQLRKGTGAAILSHILGVARERGYRRVSLETGSGPAFEPAHALYRQFGFTECAAFGEYPVADPFSRFMTKPI